VLPSRGRGPPARVETRSSSAPAGTAATAPPAAPRGYCSA